MSAEQMVSTEGRFMRSFIRDDLKLEEDKRVREVNLKF